MKRGLYRSESDEFGEMFDNILLLKHVSSLSRVKRSKSDLNAMTSSPGNVACSSGSSVLVDAECDTDNEVSDSESFCFFNDDLVNIEEPRNDDDANSQSLEMTSSSHESNVCVRSFKRVDHSTAYLEAYDTLTLTIIGYRVVRDAVNSVFVQFHITYRLNNGLEQHVWRRHREFLQLGTSIKARQKQHDDCGKAFCAWTALEAYKSLFFHSLEPSHLMERQRRLLQFISEYMFVAENNRELFAFLGISPSPSES